MTHTISQTLTWSALTALPVILLALLIGRIRVPARLKAWCCRLAFVKLVLGLFPIGVALAAPAAVRGVAPDANPRLELLLVVLVSRWVAGLAVVLFDLTKGYLASRKMIAAASMSSCGELERLARNSGMKCPQVRRGNDEGLPFAAGIFRPVIVIPTQPCES